MRRLRDILRWRQRRDADLQDEIASHIALATADRMAAGEDAAAARQAALREFGNVTMTREATRQSWGHLWLDRLSDVGRDIRYALRLLGRSPAYSCIVAAVLALGIGTNLIVFGLFQALALTPLAGVRNAAGLQFVVARTSEGRDVGLPYRDYEFLRDRVRSYDGLAGSFLQGWMMGRGASARRVFGEYVSGNYFEVLGVRAQHGRTLTIGDEQPGGTPPAVIGDTLWRREFGADPAVVGRTVHINTTPFTIVGVADAEFRGSIAGIATELFLPYPATVRADNTETPWVFAFGRPRDGVTLDAARAEAAALAAALDRDRPLDGFRQRAQVVRIWESPQGAQTYMMPATTLMGATSALLLVVVCANVAGLVLVRGLARRGEIAARLSVGASRGRVVRLLLIETLLLAIPGAVAGWFVPILAEPYLVAAQPSTVSLPLYFNVSGTLGAPLAAALGCLSALLAGLMPALRASRLDLAAAMKDGLSPSGAGRSRLRSVLVVSQVAMSLVLLVGMVLVMRSLEAARRADPGFDAAPVASVLIDLLPAGYDDARGRVFYARLLEALRADPAIEAASVMKDPLLMMMEFNRRAFAVEGHQPGRDEETQFLFNVVGTAHFSTLGIPLLAGREFGDRDHPDAAHVAVVNETLARRYWGGPEAALGKQLRTPEWPNGSMRSLTVIGVAADIKYARLNEAPRPYVYLPHMQAFNYQMFVHARGRGAVEASTAAVHRHLQALDPTLPVLDSAPLRDLTSIGVGVYDITARTLRIVGLVAVALTALGIFGLVAYSVKQGSHDIGIRIAIGAGRGRIARRYLGHGLRLGFVGSVVGLAAALGSTRLMQPLLYGVSAVDPVSFAVAVAALLAVTVAACVVPAWRAAQVDPLVALRHH